ncbi:hypothetical protein [Alteromonas sp. W364]|uniref:hypothetical protein n=1 Tax=Alteromonas sp. W364 TaxID=3075610 RepID=UPI0028859A99|nr:hypothetical protein [Alteromonas sp. W364]MDT0628054.1 hypothetical protein [Alteromonas sp. W364]
MKFAISIFLLLTLFAPSVSGKLRIQGCDNLETLDAQHFVLFNKKELIELGECLALEVLKGNNAYDWGNTCREYIEDEQAILGTLVLSKLEAIQIGQCVGAINYIYVRYHKEEGQFASCFKGKKAVQLLADLRGDSLNKRELKTLLCRR